MGLAMDTESESTRLWRLPDGSRSVRSPWVWRGMLMMSLIAVGLALGLLGQGRGLYAALWGVIAAGWFGISMWLWRQHVREDDRLYEERKKNKR
jgi:hypothetical protein